jgi:hypothetical protein
MNAWFNYEATLKILLFSILAGAGLPAVFAFGIRLQAVGAGAVATGDGSAPHRNPVLLAIAWAIYGLVVAVIIVALLYIARDFIAHHTGWAFLGAKPK